MAHAEAPLSVNFKPNKEYDAPLITVRAETPEELMEKLTLIESNGLFATVGRVDAQLKAAFNMGAGLGATTVADPAPVAAPVAAPPAAVAPPAPAPVAAPPVAAPAPDAAVPFAPMILGMPAVLKTSKPDAKRQWRAWADPRPFSQVQHIKDNKTNDPNHPGLASGSHVFWAFID